MPRKRVYPTNPLPSAATWDGAPTTDQESVLNGIDPRVPETPMEAMMLAEPFDEPVLSKRELGPIIASVGDSLAVLDDRRRWIVEAHIWRGRSFRQIAAELALSKTHVDRLYREALVLLGDELRSSGAASDIGRVLGKVVA